ncbi:hypothetical protein SAMN05428975_1774 [Mucilaginibacter sp. OK268]|nr:hypothetical protein SAMN05428975_1774 [Mucilaginibacter sp. OK268]
MAVGILRGEIKYDQSSLNVNKIRIDDGDNNSRRINLFD